MAFEKMTEERAKDFGTFVKYSTYAAAVIAVVLFVLVVWAI